ncbi:MAG: sugar phosphate isomerase/epimerase [Planctomycetaceae bacterium]|nr:sugar phosphate isomerase/epimerase [Planctomycetaceae bacterium]
MILGINGATTENCSLEEDIRIAGACGYEVVEIRMDKMETYLKNHSFDDLKALMRTAGVRPWTINAIGMSTMQDAAGEARVMKETEQFAEFAAAIECPWIVACPGAKEKASWDEIITKSAASFAKQADIAWKKRVSLSFEFLGFPWASVQTVSEAYAVVKAANRGNTGITIDTAHFYSGSSTLAEISALPSQALAVFHMNDLIDKPKAEIGDYDRVMPGDGVIPLADIVKEVRRIGFDGVASIEIFNHDFNKQDPNAVAKKAIETMSKYVK